MTQCVLVNGVCNEVSKTNTIPKLHQTDFTMESLKLTHGSQKKKNGWKRIFT